MTSFSTPFFGRRQVLPKTQFVALTLALLLALTALPVLADGSGGADSLRWAQLGEYYTAKAAESGQKAASDRYNQMAAFYTASDADTARLAALGELFTAQRLEASQSAAAARYEALAAYFDEAAGIVVTQDAGELAENPELKAALNWESAVAAESSSDFLAANPEFIPTSSWAAGGAAGATDSDFLADNPEFKSARSWTGAAAAESEFLATNPETKYASGWGGSAGGAAAVGNSQNPELSAFQSFCGC